MHILKKNVCTREVFIAPVWRCWFWFCMFSASALSSCFCWSPIGCHSLFSLILLGLIFLNNHNQSLFSIRTYVCTYIVYPKSKIINPKPNVYIYVRNVPWSCWTTMDTNHWLDSWNVNKIRIFYCRTIGKKTLHYHDKNSLYIKIIWIKVQA